jgi:hypothetical protein
MGWANPFTWIVCANHLIGFDAALNHPFGSDAEARVGERQNKRGKGEEMALYTTTPRAE